MTNPLLKVENLRVSFSGVEVVKGISFELYEGETLGIVGESGSGKSVTVQAITGLIHAQVSGNVWFEGKNLFESKVLGTKIGMVFQDPMSSLNPTLKIGAQIMEGLLFHKLATRKQAKEKAIELLRLTDITEPEERFSQYPHQLSGGMRQRVLIAIAIACNPRLIIADEPTSALDVTVQKQILELLKEIKVKFRTSMIFISHDLAVIASICENVLVMYQGSIVERGTVGEVLSNPQHPYTQMLLRSRFRRDLELV